MDNTIYNIIIVGVGGQGIILASEILSETALLSGYDVRTSEVHGMAQRGGSVTSHVRFGKDVKSPLIERGYADYMLAFEKLEGLRYCDFLKNNATVILNNREIIPTIVSAGLGEYPKNAGSHIRKLGFNVVMVDAHELATKAGSSKVANVVLLASLASLLNLENDIWLDVIRRRVPKEFLDINLNAFRLGCEALSREKSLYDS